MRVGAPNPCRCLRRAGCPSNASLRPDQYRPELRTLGLCLRLVDTGAQHSPSCGRAKRFVAQACYHAILSDEDGGSTTYRPPATDAREDRLLGCRLGHCRAPLPAACCFDDLNIERRQVQPPETTRRKWRARCAPVRANVLVCHRDQWHEVWTRMRQNIEIIGVIVLDDE
jgi:hypothetical protein